jgi:ABC-type glycerol-3-phosphate transport system substrate-binding protein
MSPRRLVRPALVVLALALTVAACSSSSTPGTAAPGTTAAPSYATVEDLAKQLEAKGITCKLEYEGLRQEDKTLSICVVNGEQGTLTIWDKPDVLAKFLASSVSGTGATAVGANWTIDVDTVANAQKLTAALGGQVKSADSGTNAPRTTTS